MGVSTLPFSVTLEILAPSRRVITPEAAFTPPLIATTMMLARQIPAMLQMVAKTFLSAVTITMLAHEIPATAVSVVAMSIFHPSAMTIMLVRRIGATQCPDVSSLQSTARRQTGVLLLPAALQVDAQSPLLLAMITMPVLLTLVILPPVASSSQLHAMTITLAQLIHATEQQDVSSQQ
jgi:hypothetical protein